MALAIPTRVEGSCLRLRTLDFSGSLVFSVLLMTAIGNGVVLYGFGVFDGTAAASVPRSNGLVLHASAVSLPSSLLGSVPVTAVITPPETVGPANPGTASQASPHGKNPGSGPNTATLPSGKKQYQTGLGLEGINGAESGCFQPVFGTRSGRVCQATLPLACRRRATRAAGGSSTSCRARFLSTSRTSRSSG